MIFHCIVHGHLRRAQGKETDERRLRTDDCDLWKVDRILHSYVREGILELIQKQDQAFVHAHFE